MAVSGVSLSVAPGEHVAVIGGNGSGKTTLLRAVMGLHRDRSGEILADGQALPPTPPIPHPRMVWMPQRQPRGQFPFTVRELLASGPNEPASRDTADRLGIGALLQRPLSALSGGQLQRAFLARALGGLAGGGGLLLAAAPLAALPATMLVVTHDLALARKCGRVLQMAQGSIREFAL
jgi:zinc transport system ATP-binding protein